METLRNYTFLPWLRQGIAAEIPDPDNLGKDGSPVAPERAQVQVSFNVSTEPISRPVHLLGPGDIVGINPRAIIKTEPRHGVTDFEANYLAYVEFYEEEFLWRFTPAKAAGDLEQSQLRPWIFLVVLAEDEFDEKKTTGPLPAFEIKAELDPNDLFPNKAQSWAWAHVHVSQNIIGGQPITIDDQSARNVEQNLEAILRANPDNASSRLLCPRKLKENTAYHAFVIPAFESGRLAGLGEEVPSTIDGQQPSWGTGQPVQTVYPIYYRWFFRTGSKGDFEFLVDLLEPRPVDKRVGVREMDMQQPGYEVDGMEPPLDVMGLEGALKSPDMESFPTEWPPQVTDPPEPGSAEAFLTQLETKVNLQFTIQQEESANNPHPDPIISPPLYGKWYGLAEKLEAQSGTGWVNELNRDPRYRTPAGAGTQVIQKDQENLMQQAWSQLGELLQANQKIRQLQLAWMSSYVMFQKNILPQSHDQLMAFTQAVQSRVLGSPTTIARQVAESRLPQAALDPAFRKMTRARGAVMRKIVTDTQASPRAVISELNEGKLTAAPDAPEPTGQISLDQLAEVAVPTGLSEQLRRWLRDKIVFRVLIAVIILAVVLLFVTGAFVVFAVVTVAAFALLLYTERLRRQLETAVALRESAFTVASVNEIPPRSNFVLTEFDSPMPTIARTGSGDSVEAANFKVALKDAFNVYQSPPPRSPERQPLFINNAVVTLKRSLDPSFAIPRRAEFLLKIPAKVKGSYLRPNKTLVTVMAHPVFSQPMYRPLRDISSEFLVPNLELIPNNTISLMETNQRFIEAYMVGLNHEMGCELLWREFPTDQRGSYFRQFWDVADQVNRDNKTPAQLEEELLDVTRLHTWDKSTTLGSHENRPLPSGAEPGEARLVLVIRGDLLKKYPTAVIYAQRAKWSPEDNPNVRVLDEEGDPAQTIKNPVFKAEIEPDIRFLGFDLTASVAKGSSKVADANPGWFFVIQERPGEPRFGLDNFSDESPATATTWDELAWEHLENFDTLGFIDFNAGINEDVPDDSIDGKFEWGRNAADMAYILYQVPVMVAFHGADMLN